MTRLLFAVVLTLFSALPARAVDIREVTSPGGIKAWLVEEHSIPFTALELRFKGGSSLDQPGKRGATLLMMALLEEGSGDLDSQGFAEARDALAAEFDFDAYDDSVTISARMLSENRDEAAALLKTALTDPRFDADAVERVRAQIVSIIQSDDTDPNSLAGREFNRLAFGDHPYGTDRQRTLVVRELRVDRLPEKGRIRRDPGFEVNNRRSAGMRTRGRSLVGHRMDQEVADVLPAPRRPNWPEVDPTRNRTGPEHHHPRRRLPTNRLQPHGTTDLQPEILRP